VTTVSVSLCLLSARGGHPRKLYSFPTRRSSDLDSVMPNALLDSLIARGLADPSPLADSREALRLGYRFDSFRARYQASGDGSARDRKSTRLNSSHVKISYAVFCWKKKTTNNTRS